MKIAMPLATLSLLALAACVSNGASDTPTTDEDTPTTYDAMLERAGELKEKIGAAAEQEVATQTGTATYNGIAGFALDQDANPTYLSNIVLNANFDTSTIGGSLSNFRDAEDNTFAGAVELENGGLTGVDFGASLVGQVTVGETVYNASGNISGEFSGSGAEYASGLVSINLGAGGEYGGYFGAEKAEK